MPGQPKRALLLATLRARAEREIGEGASELDYVEDFLQNGGMLSQLAGDLAIEMKESCSRSFLSSTVNNISPDAKGRIGLARREGTSAVVEEAIEIADTAPESSTGVLKAKMQVGARQWWAERQNPEAWGTKPTGVILNIGQLSLEAMRAPLPSRPAVLALSVVADAEIVDDDDSAEAVDERSQP